jgi:uncharacterized membrane protein YphA (DoxX/SURF4 family)
MTTVSTSLGTNVTRGDQQSPAANGLALVRVTIGAMLLWVFFENLGKGLYTPAGYAGLINYYIKAEISLGVLLLIGLLTRPVGLVAFLFLGSLWISELGTAWIWELLVPVLASLGLAIGRAGRKWGVDAWLSQRWPSSPWW